MPDSPRQCSWLIRKAIAAVFDSEQASVVGPETGPVRVVEESRLREVEAELARLISDHDGVPAVWVCDRCGQPLGKDGRCNSGIHVGPGEEANGMAVATTDLVAEKRQAEARAERLEADLQEATAALQWIETRLSRHREPRVEAIDKALERARGVLRTDAG